MQYYLPQSQQESKAPRKLPIGRVLLLLVLGLGIYKYLEPKEQGKKPKELSKKELVTSSSQALNSSSSEKKVIELNSWKTEKGALAQRLDLDNGLVRWDQIMRFKDLSEEKRELALWAHQRCGKTQVKVRYYGEKLEEWSFECGIKNEFRRRGKGPWVDRDGCALGLICWQEPMTKYVSLRDSLSREILHAQALFSTSVLAVADGRVQSIGKNPHSFLEIKLASGVKVRYEGLKTWNEDLNPGHGIKKGDLLAKIAKDEVLSLTISEGLRYYSLGEKIKGSHPYHENLWEVDEN